LGESVSGDFGGCLCYDISKGGMRLRSNDFVPLSTEMVFRVPLGPEDVVEMAGEVVWTQKYPHAESYQLGVQFLEKENTAQGKRVLDQMIEQRDPL